jgi:hypothetical protein
MATLLPLTQFPSRAIITAWLALALVIPAPAHCYTLDRLLELPLERLLELQITATGHSASAPDAADLPCKERCRHGA